MRYYLFPYLATSIKLYREIGKKFSFIPMQQTFIELYFCGRFSGYNRIGDHPLTSRQCRLLDKGVLIIFSLRPFNGILVINQLGQFLDDVTLTAGIRDKHERLFVHPVYVTISRAIGHLSTTFVTSRRKLVVLHVTNTNH